MDAIKTEGLTKYYGRSRGILEMDLFVKEGDFFGLIGPNGAGKSTMIRILLGLIAPTGGSARIFGMDVARRKKEVLSEVGYMPGEAAFYHNMRVEEVIQLSAKLRGKDCAKEAERLCERLELSPNRRIRELSLGNRKKVSIVCALQHRPRLCILDEPTSGLDPLMQREFYRILQEQNKEGTTVFLSSHILPEIQRYCRHAAVIREGKILAADSVERLGHTGAKRVTLRGAGEIPAMEGIKKLEKDGDTIRFLYSGSLKRLLGVLENFSLEDLSIGEPDLEEIFLHYYGKEEKENGALTS